MIFRYAVIALVILFTGCATQPEIIPDEMIDLTYEELKTSYGTCIGKGIVSSKGAKPWKLNYSFASKNDSSYIQFRDILGRRVLFIQALPIDIKIWDMQKNLQYYYNDKISIPLLDVVDSNDIAQILWGKVPDGFNQSGLEYDSDTTSNIVNFNMSVSSLGNVLNMVTYQMDNEGTIIEFKINERDYGVSETNLLKGIPEKVPYNE